MDPLKITKITTAASGWRAALVNMNESKADPRPAIELPIACWGLVEGEDEDGHFTQKVIALASLGPVLQNPASLTTFIGLLEPGRKIADLFEMARMRSKTLRPSQDAEIALDAGGESPSIGGGQGEVDDGSGGPGGVPPRT